ncbi:MAG: SEL1-like repeat protein [Prevotella sp.]|nr:SEL1-like repeat protein [Prevotella sp.]
MNLKNDVNYIKSKGQMKKLFLFYLLLLVHCAVTAQPDEKLVRKATSGNVKAQRELGSYYDVKGDSANFVHWYMMAATQNDEKAIRELGMFFDRRKDYRNAAVWWKNLITKKKGDLWASARLGDYYRKGKGVERNMEEALFWYKASIPKMEETLSTTLGDVMVGLAICNDSLGRYNEALKWYQKCANARGPEYAKPEIYYFINRAGLIGLVRMFYLGLGVEKNYKLVNQYVDKLVNTYKVTWFADIAYSQQEDSMHFLWMNIASHFSNVWLVELAKLYEKGKGVTKDYERAFKIYQAIINVVGGISSKGETPSPNDNIAFYRSYGRQGIMYYYGNYVTQNAEEAFLRLKISAMMTNDSGVLLTLAYCYRDGIGTEQDMEKYKEWLNKAEEAGDNDAIQLRKMAREANPDNKSFPFK